MATPAAWNVNPSSPAPAQVTGVYVVTATVQPRTGIVSVELPVFDPASPSKDSKVARNSILKLLEGECNDIRPLNFRKQYERDMITIDPYYPFAPGWSTLSAQRGVRHRRRDSRAEQDGDARRDRGAQHWHPPGASAPSHLLLAGGRILFWHQHRRERRAHGQAERAGGEAQGGRGRERGNGVAARHHAERHRGARGGE